MEENATEEKPIKLSLTIDAGFLAEMDQLKERLQSPNLTTAICNAVRLVNTLYGYEAQGYELNITKDGNTIRFQMPV